MSRRRRLSSSRSTDPERGAVYPTLDLHRETADSALRRAERWLREMRDDGEAMVRIVTGRGKHSAAGPVLRGEIEGLLRTMTGGLVRSVEREAGGGAFRVLLRLREGPVAPRDPPPLRASPELRRQAEEALSELGVSPTPDLIALEIARLRAARAHEGEGTE